MSFIDNEFANRLTTPTMPGIDPTGVSGGASLPPPQPMGDGAPRPWSLIDFSTPAQETNPPSWAMPGYDTSGAASQQAAQPWSVTDYSEPYQPPSSISPEFGQALGMFDQQRADIYGQGATYGLQPWEAQQPQDETASGLFNSMRSNIHGLQADAIIQQEGGIAPVAGAEWDAASGLWLLLDGQVYDPIGKKTFWPPPGYLDDVRAAHRGEAVRQPSGFAANIAPFTTSLLPKDWTEAIPNPSWAPLRNVVEGVTSPLGIASLPFGAGSIPASIGRNLLAEVGAAYVNENPGATDWLGPAQPIAPFIAGALAYSAPDIAEGLAKAFTRNAPREVAALPEEGLGRYFGEADDLDPTMRYESGFGVKFPPGEAGRDVINWDVLEEPQLVDTERPVTWFPLEERRLRFEGGAPSSVTEDFGSGLGNLFKPIKDRLHITEPDSPALVAKAIPGEKPSTTVLRRLEGETNVQLSEIARDTQRGYRLLQDVNLPGTTKVGTRLFVKRTPEVEQLYKALHGEVPPGTLSRDMRGVYDDIKRAIDVETAKTVDFNPEFVPREDYFYRGWKEPKETRAGSSQFAGRPGFTRQRVDATFSELLDAGYEPISWNPYDMLALRRAAGVNYREQKAFIEQLKEVGLVQDASSSVVPDDWRVPRVGPAFEGKPYVRQPGQAMDALARLEPESARVAFTPKLAVPNDIADVLENMYGSLLSLGKVGPVDVLKTLRAFGGGTKRLRLLGSLFQQVDFATRTGAAGFGGAIDALLAGKPITAVKRLASTPVEMAKLVRANLSPGARGGLRDEILSGKPLFAGRDISLRSIAEAGWIQRDTSILPRELKKTLADIAGPRPGSIALARLRNIDRAMQRGLFDGVYPEAQTFAIKNLIAPRLVRLHPKWTDAQLSGAIASEVNKMFSTLGDWQTVFKNRGMREITRNLIFSTNEAESLLRSAISVVPGASIDSGLWQRYWAGGFLFLAATANVVHYAVTGEWLPLDRYTPVKNDDNGPFGGWSYNSKFLSPDIPVKGRNGVNVTADLVGQLDTAFRLLDPKSWIESRFAVVPRAVVNQWNGTDFTGRPLDTPLSRFAQALSDLGMPIGLGNILSATGAVPETEARLGPIGQAFQGTGINLRAETTPDLKDRKAGEKYPGKKWNDLTGPQQDAIVAGDPDFAAELRTRRDEAAARGDDFAIRQQQADLHKQETRTQQEGLDARLQSGEITIKEWNDARNERLATDRGFWKGVYATAPEGQRENALTRLYDFIDSVTDPVTKEVDWEKVDAYEAGLNDTDRQFIADSAGRNSTDLEKVHSADVAKIEASGYFDVESGKAQWRKEHPDIDALIRKWGYGESTTKVLDLEKTLSTQQEASDKALQSGEVSGDDWRDMLHSRLDQLRGAKEAIYADLTDKERQPIDAWFDMITAHTDAQGQVDWDAVDADLQAAPAEIRQAVEGRVRTYLSPAVARYYEVTAQADETGYFDQKDRTWAKFKEAYPDALGKWATFDDWYEGAVQRKRDAILAAGYDPRYARTEAERLVQATNTYQQVNEYTKTHFRHRWVVDNPELAKDLWFFGLFTPDKAEREFLEKRQ